MSKQEAKQHIDSKSPQQEARRSRGRVPGQIAFPRNSLKQALEVAKAIERDNAGQPYDPILLATQSLKTTNRSSKFEILATSSERYGLTIGNSRAKSIALTPLGSAIVAPTDESKTGTNIREALLTPDLFREFYTRYDRKNIPREEIVRNVLEKDLKVPRGDVTACYEVLIQNISDYNLIVNSGENKLLYLDNLGKASAVTLVSQSEESSEVEPEIGEGSTEGLIAGKIGGTSSPPAIIEVKVPRVFISHSKNKTILGQIKQVLDFGKFQYVIAEEKETTAIPLPDKVFNLMWECNCAIINMSADSEKKQGDTFSINENVIAELWGAFLHYKKRVIIVIDSRLKDRLPSMMQGLTAIFYEGDKLAWDDGIRLQKALDEFRSQL